MMRFFKNLNKKLLAVQASVTVGFLFAFADQAQAATQYYNEYPADSAMYRQYLLVNPHHQNFSNIARNVTHSIEDFPGLLTGGAYLIGLGMGILGILKVKDHVDNPQQSPLKEGAIRLAAGGALFALPIVFEAMKSTIGIGSETMKPAQLNHVSFGVL